MIVWHEGFRVKAHPGGKTEVFLGRRKIGVWWISPPAYVGLICGENLPHNARVAVEAARDRLQAKAGGQR